MPSSPKPIGILVRPAAPKPAAPPDGRALRVGRKPACDMTPEEWKALMDHMAAECPEYDWSLFEQPKPASPEAIARGHAEAERQGL